MILETFLRGSTWTDLRVHGLLPLQSKNKVSLRSLSMLLRQLPVADSNTYGKMVLESVDLARQAVQLDVTDGTSWCE